MKIKINRIVLLNVSIVLVTLFVGLVFIYMPFSRKYSSLKFQILREKQKNILIAKINALSKHVASYRKRMPEDKDASWLLGELSRMLGEEEVEAVSIKPGVPEENTLYTKLSVTLGTVSTYGQLARFISRVESSEKFLKVESINMKRLDLAEDFDRYKDEFQGFDVKAHIVVSTIVLKE